MDLVFILAIIILIGSLAGYFFYRRREKKWHEATLTPKQREEEDLGYHDSEKKIDWNTKTPSERPTKGPKNTW